MELNFRAVGKITGMILTALSVFLLAPFIVSLIYHEPDCGRACLSVAIPTAAIGLLLFFFIHRKPNDRMTHRDGFLLVSLAWLLMSIIGALPFMLQGSIHNFFHAFFETASGFSTTGATILSDVESFPVSLMFWRMFTHWIGGMGIVVCLISFLPTMGLTGENIALPEATRSTLQKITPNIWDTAKILLILYSALTAIEMILLKISGMNVYDSIVYAFSTMGTGGFTTHNEGLTYYDSALIDGIITVFMLIAAGSFTLYHSLYKRTLHAFRHNTELKLYLMIIVSGTVLTTLALFISNTYDTLSSAFRHGVFQVVSILSTTGMSNADFAAWPTFCLMLFLILFFIGGCSASTAGGIKVVRAAVMFKMIKRSVFLKLHPNTMTRIRIGKRLLPSDIVQDVCSYVMIYFATVFITALLISVDGNGFLTNFTAAASCVANIGPGMGAVGPSGNYAIYSEFSLTVLSLAMIAGRLELFTLFMLFSPKYWKPAH